MQSIDITSSLLTEQGFALKVEGPTVVLESKLKGVYPKRFTVYPKDWNKTAKKVEDILKEAGFKQEIIQLVLKDMSDNFKLIVGKPSSSSSPNNNNSALIISGPKMAPKAIRANCTMEEWRTKVKQKHDALKEDYVTKSTTTAISQSQA